MNISDVHVKLHSMQRYLRGKCYTKKEYKEWVDKGTLKVKIFRALMPNESFLSVILAAIEKHKGDFMMQAAIAAAFLEIANAINQQKKGSKP